MPPDPGAGPAGPEIDWSAMRSHDEAGTLTVHEIALRAGMPDPALRVRARREG